MAPPPHLPTIAIPKGRSAAEQRLGAIAALHQPIWDARLGDLLGPTCGQCRGSQWPCGTALLLGHWPNVEV